MFDIFFISYNETNVEGNWEQLLSYHPLSKRIHGIRGIHRAHLICNDLSDTEYFFTVDGDNWIIKPLIYDKEIIADLTLFHCIDPLLIHTPTSLGSVKLWRKNSFIKFDMSSGDFSLFATKTKNVDPECFSINRYNASEFDAWKTSFRHCVKLLSCILKDKRDKSNIEMYLNRWINTKSSHELNADWAYRGYCDADQYVLKYDNDIEKLNLINDYNWLREYFSNLYKL
jgi:hypothetical protein